jgi:hypothetical protein
MAKVVLDAAQGIGRKSTLCICLWEIPQTSARGRGIEAESPVLRSKMRPKNENTKQTTQ